MTVTRPGNPSRYPTQPDLLRRTNSSHSSQANSTKRSRGPINKRACQRCRQGKIKCDGDAETGKPCSNCDPELCKYDNSPRKNKQVENLKQRLQKVEDKLVSILKSSSDKLELTYIEKETLCLLYENKERFNGSPVFQGLLEAIKQCQLDRQLLVYTYSLLERISTNEDKISGIIDSLQRVLIAATERAKSLSISPTNTQLEQQQQYDSSIMSGSVDPTMILTSNPSNLSAISSFENNMCHNCETNGLNHVHTSSSDDDGSESFSNGYECNDDGSGGPSTPNEQNHPNCYESKPFQASNGSAHQLPGSSQMLEVADYYPYSYSLPQAEYSSLFFFDHQTTSPTDENMYLKLS
ncbi:17541_t:CDS:1 [Cetraspora pellucida]|uniref:17541_t:CDS:1 n=1 Tax=Cetraspora pellucida TaxID=1433469 RepID=A0A9N8VP08_9GLOM|nr:17541_t:CDS:1 [Cetraspora pellucida]